MRAEQAAYRALLRVARQADRKPLQLTTLVGLPCQAFDRKSGLVVQRAQAHRCPLVEDAVCEAAGGFLEFAQPAGQAAASVRKHRRRSEALGFCYLPGARELLRRFSDAQDLSFRLQRAAAPKPQVKLPKLELEFISGPSMGKKLVLGEQAAERVGKRLFLEEEEERRDCLQVPSLESLAPPPNLVTVGPQLDGQGDELRLRRLEIGEYSSRAAFGQFLIAHPLFGIVDTAFDKTIVLLSAVDDTNRQVKGLVINEPTRGDLRSVLAGWSCRTGDGGALRMSEEDMRVMEALDPLLDAPLLLGGNLRSETLLESITWLHTLGDVVPGAMQITRDLWLGGQASSLAGLVASGQAELSRIRPVLGHMAWSIPQLELDLKRGAWIRAQAAEPEVALRLCMAALPAAHDNGARSRHQATLWRASLNALGLPDLASFPRGKAVDETIRSFFQSHYRNQSTLA